MDLRFVADATVHRLYPAVCLHRPRDAATELTAHSVSGEHTGFVAAESTPI